MSSAAWKITAGGSGRMAAWIGVGIGAAVFGCAVGQHPALALLGVALALVVLAVPFVDDLSVLMFWLLPYLILNAPAGGVTLKVPEAAAYLFAAAALARALLRRERICLPPGTPLVFVFLAVAALSGAFAPPIPAGMEGEKYTGLLGPDLRPASVVFWLALSWLVVAALYHVVGTSARLYQRCVCAHVLSGGIASLIGIVGYVLTLRGSDLALRAIGNGHPFVYNGGSFYRLTGVSYEPLLFAFYLVTVIPVSLIVVFYKTNWLPRPLAVLSLVLQGLALLLTFSAGGWASLFLGLLLMVWLLRPKNLTWKSAIPFLAGVTMLAGAATVFCVVNPILSRTMNSAIQKITSGGYKARDDENLAGMRIWENHFWLGAGPGMTPFHFLWYHPTAYTEDQASSVFVNNLYINTLAETGILGLTALLICGVVTAGLLIGVVLRCKPRRVPVYTTLAITLLCCVVQYWETQNLYLIYFPAVAGLAMAGARLGRSGEPEATTQMERTA